MARTVMTPGIRRGALVLVRTIPNPTDLRHPKYEVHCDCGSQYVITGGSWNKSLACKKCRPGGQPRKYGDRVMQGDSLYLKWASMKWRCNPDALCKKNMAWAGRGIRVCQEWQDFAVFEKWARETGYEPGLAIDRIDSDGDYEPSNCQWSSRSQNSKRCRAEYDFVKKTRRQKFIIPYDEPCYGDA